jgi:hypothetical protein
MTRRLALALAVALAAFPVLSACGGDDDDGSTSEPAATTAPAPSTPAGTEAGAAGTELTIRVWAGGDDTAAPDVEWELTCDPAGGSHPDAEAACAAIAANPLIIGPAPDAFTCTQQYGGPAIASVQGTNAGTAVNTRYSRENGCAIAHWDTALPVLPAAETLPAATTG